MKRRFKQNQYIKALLLALGVLVVSLIVVLVLLATGSTLSQQEREDNFVKSARFLSKVSVGGVDVSGQSYEQALADQQLTEMAQEFENNFTYTFIVGQTEYTYKAFELGLVSNLDQVLRQAMCFGQFGEQKKEQKNQLENSGADFDLGIHGDEAAVYQKIVELKPQIDTLPKDATFEIEDDLKSDSGAVHLADLAGVSIINEQIGADVDAAALAKLICSNVNAGDYSVITAPAIITNPKVDAQTLKKNTQKIGEMTTLFEGKTLGHPNRVNNIKIFANIINGTVLNPGDPWSINEAAGPRNSETAKTMGWTEAPSISNGRYEKELGGGVCQISSTTYNAAIRAEMTIEQRRPHSWPSSYVPKGMDATISTGGPDLVISNPYDSPVYMVAYVNEEEYKLTVQFYGPPLVHGYTVDFTNDLVGTAKAPEPTYHYNATHDPDGDPITEGKTITWVEPRDGQTWRVYKQYKDKEGNVVKSEFFSEDKYRAYAGVFYVNGPDPATVLPSLDGEATEQ